jgi:archaellum biogenesis protein FlaJ (TadC family)
MNRLEAYVAYIGRLLTYCDIGVSAKKFAFFTLWFPLMLGFLAALFFIREPPVVMGVVLAATFAAVEVAVLGFLMIVKNRRAEDAEEMMPDFLLLVANNIRSGMTPDTALVVSARGEFGVLGREVMTVMREAVSGRPFEELLMKITERVDSKPITGTINLIVEGIYSGGDLPSLLEKTSYDIRNMKAVQKDISAVIVTYQMFIAAAVMFGAPLLLAVATNIVEVMGAMRAKLSAGGIPAGTGSFMQFGGEAEVGADTLVFFAGSAILVNAFFASMALGLISKGRKVEGLMYFPFVFMVSILFFFAVRMGLRALLGGIMPLD